MGERARRARLRPDDADDEARIGAGSGVGAQPPGSAESGRAHPTYDGSVEGGATRARANRESRIADRRRPFARRVARVMRATRRRVPAFGMRDRGGATAASGRGMSLARETMWPARDGCCITCTFRETEDDVRLSAR